MWPAYQTLDGMLSMADKDIAQGSTDFFSVQVVAAGNSKQRRISGAALALQSLFNNPEGL